MSKIILVTGDRNYDDHARIDKALREHAEVGNLLIEGGAYGADQLAANFWHYRAQLPYVTMPAPWDRAGRAAGPMRNLAMLKGLSIAPHALLQPNLVLAFHKDIKRSRGTKHCIEEAEKLGIEVILYDE